jgi:flavin-dependent dehydrogenase
MTSAAPAIVGGGPAGCAAAIRLVQAGERPLLIERRPDGGDALCGGFLSWRTLDRLEAFGISREELGGHAVTALRIIAGKRVLQAALPAPAMGLSRRRLDSLMLMRAQALGASIVHATASFADGRLRLDGGEVVDCGCLFLATGKHDLLTR